MTKTKKYSKDAFDRYYASKRTVDDLAEVVEDLAITVAVVHEQLLDLSKVVYGIPTTRSRRKSRFTNKGRSRR